MPFGGSPRAHSPGPASASAPSTPPRGRINLVATPPRSRPGDRSSSAPRSATPPPGASVRQMHALEVEVNNTHWPSRIVPPQRLRSLELQMAESLTEVNQTVRGHHDAVQSTKAKCQILSAVLVTKSAPGNLYTVFAFSLSGDAGGSWAAQLDRFEAESSLLLAGSNWTHFGTVEPRPNAIARRYRWDGPGSRCPPPGHLRPWVSLTCGADAAARVDAQAELQVAEDVTLHWEPWPGTPGLIVTIVVSQHTFSSVSWVNPDLVAFILMDWLRGCAR